MDLIATAIVTLLSDDHADKRDNKTIIEAYETLKAVIRQKFGVESSLIEAVEMLEKRPDSIARREVLNEEISAVEAAKDPEVLMIAQELLDQINQLDQKDDQLRAYDVTTPAVYVPLQRPVRTDHFVGREAELDQLLSSLGPGKIVTILGPSGVGKSALTAKAIWALTPDNNLSKQFPDGIIYHSFYVQPQAMLALERIARAYGEDISPTPFEAAKRALTGRKALLVFDQAEHADDLTKVLAVRGECGVLVISRKHITEADTQHKLESLTLDDAVHLLGLEAWGWVTAADEETAREICRLIGCLPLAVRLVGRFLGVRRQHGRSFLQWLHSTPLHPQKQTMDYDQVMPVIVGYILTELGDEVAQQTLAVIGLLALAPFNQEVIAEAMAKRTHGGLFGTVQKFFKQKTEEQVPEIGLALDMLVNYGLLQWVGRGYEVTHPIIHTYARQHLSAPEGAIDRLVTYYTTLVGEQILLGLEGYTRLDAERPHLIGVLTGCIRQEKWEAAHTMAAALEDYLDLQGHWTERVIVSEAGLTASRNLGGHNEGAWLGNLGLVYMNGGQPERAIEYYEQALKIARKTNDLRSEGNWLGNMGLAHRDLEKIDSARQYLQQAIKIFDQIQSPNADLIRDWLSEFEDE